MPCPFKNLVRKSHNNGHGSSSVKCGRDKTRQYSIAAIPQSDALENKSRYFYIMPAPDNESKSKYGNLLKLCIYIFISVCSTIS